MEKHQKITFNCETCGNETTVYYSHYINCKHHTCSRKCLSKLRKTFLWSEDRKKTYSDQMKGEKNPNYGKNWSDEKKQKQSEIIKSKQTDEIRWKVGTANRGKKRPKDAIAKQMVTRSQRTYARLVHSEEVKALIGQKSSAKFTPEYRKRQRKQNEELGYWIPLKDKTNYQIYYHEANWIEKMFDKIDDPKQLQLLKERGVLNTRTNTKGVVRDHIFSRKTGFDEGVFPEILRHPSNCQLLTNSQNISKRRGGHRDRDDITLESLFTKILSYDKEWSEQLICEQKIKEYQNGKRWFRGKED